MNRSLPLIVGTRYASARHGGLLVSFLSRISIAGLVLGVALLITVLSVMNGFERELQHRILKLVPHTMFVGREPIQDWQGLRSAIEQHPDVVATAPFIHMDAMLSSGRKVEAARVQAVELLEEQKISALDDFIVEGSWAELIDHEDSVAMGNYLAVKLGLGVGDRLKVVVPSRNGARPAYGGFRVAALFHTGTTMDQELAIIGLGAGQSLLSMGNAVQGVRAQIDQVFESRRISWEIINQLPPGYYARDWRQLYGNLYQSIQLSRRLVTLMIIMVIAVALFNVVSSLVMVVTDKREDIAILKTMGADSRDILQIFLIHGLIIAFLGTGLGVGLGCLLSHYLPAVVAWAEGFFGFHFLNTSVYPVDYIPADLRTNDVLIIGGTAVAMSLVATIYPAVRASRVAPAVALRWS